AWSAVGMPYCDAHGRSLGSEAPHETLAQEPGAAEYADCCHGFASGCCLDLSTIVECALDASDFLEELIAPSFATKTAVSARPLRPATKVARLFLLQMLLKGVGPLDFIAQRRRREFKKFGHWFTLALPIAAEARDKYRERQQAGVSFGVVDSGARPEQRIDH